MKITSYVELTPAQEHTLDAFKSVVVRTALLTPTVVATFSTFQVQDVKVTIDQNGVIESVMVDERR